MNGNKVPSPPSWIRADYIKSKSNEEPILLGTAKNANALGPNNVKNSVQIKNNCPGESCILLSKNSASAEWKKIDDLFGKLIGNNKLNDDGCNYFYDYFDSSHTTNSKKYIKTCLFTINDFKSGHYRIGVNYSWKGNFKCLILLNQEYKFYEYSGTSNTKQSASFFSVYNINNSSNACEFTVYIAAATDDNTLATISDINIEFERVHKNTKSKNVKQQKENDSIIEYKKGNSYTYKTSIQKVDNLIKSINEKIKQKLNFISILDEYIYIEFIFPLTKEEKSILDNIINDIIN